MADTNITKLNTPVFDRAIEAFKDNDVLRPLIGKYIADGYSMAHDIEFLQVTKPTDIIVSRSYPGYREVDLNGKFADEALAIDLADAVVMGNALAQLRQVLTRIDLPSAIISKLLPRSGQTVKRGTYQISDETASKVIVEEVQQKVPGASQAVLNAYSHLILRVLESLRLLQTSQVQKVISSHGSYALGIERLEVIFLIDALRGIFSEAHIGAITRELDADATPSVIGDTIARMMVQIATSLMEIAYRREQVQTAITLVQYQLVDPDALPMAIRSNTELARLASMANFVFAATNRLRLGIPQMEIAEMREALKAVLTTIQASPALDVISLESYSKLFGIVPASSPDGLNRGSVVYMMLNQTSKMQIVDTRIIPFGRAVQGIPGAYVPTAAIAGELNRSVLNPAVAKGLANIVADELVQQPAELGEPPILLAIGVANADIQFLAMAKSVMLALTAEKPKDGDRRTSFVPSLIYASNVAEQWRQRVLAATPGTAYFSNPQSVIAYAVAAEGFDPSPMPARTQSISVTETYPTIYRGAMERLFVDSVEKVYDLKLTLKASVGENKGIVLEIRGLGPVLSKLVEEGADSGRGPDAKFAAVAEPGVDRDIELLLTVVAAYAENGNEVISDKAKSLLVETLFGLVQHPAVRAIADRAMNEAIIKSKIDARANTHGFQELVMRAYFGTAIAILAQFGKVPRSLVGQLVKVVPVSTLSIRAQMALATTPATVQPLRSLVNG